MSSLNSKDSGSFYWNNSLPSVNPTEDIDHRRCQDPSLGSSVLEFYLYCQVSVRVVYRDPPSVSNQVVTRVCYTDGTHRGTRVLQHDITSCLELRPQRVDPPLPTRVSWLGLTPTLPTVDRPLDFWPSFILSRASVLHLRVRCHLRLVNESTSCALLPNRSDR